MNSAQSLADGFHRQAVWVTGAGQGIGLCAATTFVALGANVVGLDKAFAEAGYPFRTLVVDIADHAQAERACAHLLDEYGAAGCAGERGGNSASRRDGGGEPRGLARLFRRQCLGGLSSAPQHDRAVQAPALRRRGDGRLQCGACSAPVDGGLLRLQGCARQPRRIASRWSWRPMACDAISSLPARPTRPCSAPCGARRTPSSASSPAFQRRSSSAFRSARSRRRRRSPMSSPFWRRTSRAISSCRTSSSTAAPY